MAGVPTSSRRAVALLRSLTYSRSTRNCASSSVGALSLREHQTSTAQDGPVVFRDNEHPPTHTFTFASQNPGFRYLSPEQTVTPASSSSLSQHLSSRLCRAANPFVGTTSSARGLSSISNPMTSLPSTPRQFPTNTLNMPAFQRPFSAAPAVDPPQKATRSRTPLSSAIHLSKGSRGLLKKGPAPGPPPVISTTFDGRLRKDNRETVGYSVLAHDLSIPAVAVEASEEAAGEEGSLEEDDDAEERPGDVLTPEPSTELPVDVKKKAVFAVVQVGSHQFKVTPGDVIYTEKLLFADVNQRVRLEKVLMLGSRNETVVGRPTVIGASVEALVEEQVLAAKVIVFKKKRRKNYRRHNGHRQQLSRLRILDVVGVEE